MTRRIMKNVINSVHAVFPNFLKDLAMRPHEIPSVRAKNRSDSHISLSYRKEFLKPGLARFENRKLHMKKIELITINACVRR